MIKLTKKVIKMNKCYNCKVAKSLEDALLDARKKQELLKMTLDDYSKAVNMLNEVIEENMELRNKTIADKVSKSNTKPIMDSDKETEVKKNTDKLEEQ